MGFGASGTPPPTRVSCSYNGVRGVVDAAPYTGMPFRVVARAISPQAGCVAWTRSQRWGAAGFALRQIAFVPHAGAMWAYFVILRVRPLRWGADGNVPSLQALLSAKRADVGILRDSSSSLPTGVVRAGDRRANSPRYSRVRPCGVRGRQISDGPKTQAKAQRVWLPELMHSCAVPTGGRGRVRSGLPVTAKRLPAWGGVFFRMGGVFS